MNKPTRLTLERAAENMAEIFEAARSLGPQVIEDHDGVFTLTYTPDSSKPDAREFLAAGGRGLSDDRE